ncbi:thioredoxin family protein [Clostridium sp.]|uniref:thioredoxin family protein n=1 Tax=Clostridium sp. TaxID=1506 RepID=UPI002FC8CB75
MEIKILGYGCDKCDKVEKNTKKAIEELGIEANIEKVEDLKTILGYGVMSTPGFMVDGKIKSVGRVLSIEEIKKLLK